MKNNTFILLACVLLGISCEPIYEPCFKELMFEIPVTLAGVSDTISKGQSFTIKSSIPYELEDQNGHGIFDTKTIKIPLELTILKIDQSPISYGFDSVQIQPISGSISVNVFESTLTANDVGYSFSFDYVESDSMRNLEMNCKINETGLYAIGLESIYNFQFDPNFIKGCGEKLEYNSTKLNNGDIYENNYEMFLSTPDTSIIIKKIRDEYRYKNLGGYTFYVK